MSSQAFIYYPKTFVLKSSHGCLIIHLFRKHLIVLLVLQKVHSLSHNTIFGLGYLLVSIADSEDSLRKFTSAPLYLTVFTQLVTSCMFVFAISTKLISINVLV